MTHVLRLKEKVALTHDVHQYVFTRPSGLDFAPGQATELMLDRDGWQDEGRPFTFTSLPDQPVIEFVIKSYPEHDGVTDQLATLKRGETVEIEDPFGAIHDVGPGTFIAAGAGLTPFIPILRQRFRDRRLKGCHLIYTNRTEDDIILREEWEAMRDLKVTLTVTEGPAKTVASARIDRDFLAATLKDLSQTFYICGPESFVADVRKALCSLGIPEARIVTEEGW